MSGFSILTNNGAQVALANLGGINSRLGAVQKKISTGQQVADATDNAAVFAVAQGIRANLQQYNAVNTGLNDAQALVQTALAATTSISNLLPQITATLTQLADGSISDPQRLTYTANLKSQVDQVQTYIQDANYNGLNLIDGLNFTQGSVGYSFTYQTAAPSLRVMAGIAGEALTINPVNLQGSAVIYSQPNQALLQNAGGGFLAYVGILAYYLGYDQAGLGNSAFLVMTAGGNIGSNSYSQYNYQWYEQNTAAAIGLFISQNGNFVSRGEMFANEALAALASPSAAGSVYVVTTPFGTFYRPSFLDGALTNFTKAVNSALGSLGATANNIQLQLTFNQSIANSLNTGLGNLVDADMAQASAQLTALQTQQQLAVQTLSIANAQPQAILSLFK